jgi:hypothetical protein
MAYSVNGSTAVDPSMIISAYKSGDIAKTNSLLADAGMSEQGAINAGGNMGYTPADIAAMKANGIIFAASGTPAENVGWNSNATGPGSGSPPTTGIIGGATQPKSVPLDPNQVMSAVPTQLGNTTQWNVTPDQTVEGRIAGLMNPNNPVMVQAQTQANEMSNQRGLINSSMAVTGGQDAMYRAATPIAAADAATFAKAAGYNADEQNQFAMKNADASNQMAQANLGANTQMYGANLSAKTQLQTANISADTQRAIATMNTESQQKMAELDAATRTQIQQLQSQNATLLNTNQQASQAFNQYVVAAANIQNNANLDAANKTAALQTLWQTTQVQLSVLAHVSGLDLTSMLDMTGITNGVTPIVTPAPTPAPAAAPYFNNQT